MGDRSRVLVVEDDALVREGVESALRADGHDVHVEPDGRDLDAVLGRFRPHLALLDVGLPEGPDGFELAARIRSGPDIPVMFLTASDGIDDRIRGFDLGADDYLVKPFSMRELRARVRAVVRRTAPSAQSVLRVRDLEIDVALREASRGGVSLSLTPTEFDILARLASTPGRPWTKLDLLESVWGFRENSPHLVEVQVSGLRRKLEEHGPRVVLTCRGGAYMVPA